MTPLRSVGSIPLRPIQLSPTCSKCHITTVVLCFSPYRISMIKKKRRSLVTCYLTCMRECHARKLKNMSISTCRPTCIGEYRISDELTMPKTQRTLQMQPFYLGPARVVSCTSNKRLSEGRRRKALNNKNMLPHSSPDSEPNHRYQQHANIAPTEKALHVRSTQVTKYRHIPLRSQDLKI